jgi:glycosyltransferase involved in cell wall biosynthesis
MRDPRSTKSPLRVGLARAFPPDHALGRALRISASAVQHVGRTLTAPVETAVASARFGARSLQRGPGIGKNPTGRTIVMLVVCNLHIDPRVRQEAQALAHAGFSIIIIWPELRDMRGVLIDWGSGITFEPLPPSAGRFAERFPAFLGSAMLMAALKHSPFAFHAHDLNTALIALMAGNLTGAHVVCDFHEWFSEHVTWSSRTMTYVPQSNAQRRANKWLERRCHREASAVITVCQSIASAIDAEFAAGELPRVQVVRNIPAFAQLPSRAYPNLRTILNLKPDHLLLLYQGGVGPSRALEPVIAALAQVPNAVLVIRGPSIAHYEAHYRATARAAGVAEHQLILLPPVPSTDVIAAARGADVGVYTVADLCKSFSHALPNKVFEYMAAGLPLLVADYPEVRALVRDHAVGLTFNPADTDSIASAIRHMADRTTRTSLAHNIPAALTAMDAANEWAKLVALYHALPRP